MAKYTVKKTYMVPKILTIALSVLLIITLFLPMFTMSEFANVYHE